jgi:hypothetical protein
VIGLRRGLFLGFLVGAITAAAERFSDSGASASSEQTEGERSTLSRARAAARDEREATESRLRSSYERARHTGHMPPRHD